MLTIVHPFTNAIAIACSSNMLFPFPFSPINTLLTVVPRFSVLKSSMVFPISTLSLLMSMPGLLNIPHPCVALKASTALN